MFVNKMWLINGFVVVDLKNVKNFNILPIFISVIFINFDIF